MNLRSAPLCLALALAAMLAPAATPASAVERIDAAFLSEYSATSYVIDQGEIVTFGNRDRFLSHGIASDTASLFSAPVIGRGQTRLVRGAPFLATGGPYPFHCPIHPGMTSSLSVTAGGAPLPADATPPGAVIKVKTGNLGKLLKKRKLRLTVNPSEAADAVVKAGAGGAKLGRAERTYVRAGARAITIAVSGEAAREIAATRAQGRPVAVKVKVSLSDVAGNAAVVKGSRSLAGSPGGGGKKKKKR